MADAKQGHKSVPPPIGDRFSSGHTMLTRFSLAILCAATLAGLTGCVSPEELRREDEAACLSYGYQQGTTEFASCLQRESLARRYASYYGPYYGPGWYPYGYGLYGGPVVVAPTTAPAPPPPSPAQSGGQPRGFLGNVTRPR